MGIVRYVTKPVVQSELLNAILNVARGEVEQINVAPTGTNKSSSDVWKASILLAEDGLVNQRVAMGLLAMWGHHVVVAKNGVEAVAACDKEQFDLVLMDVQMPEMDGYQATAAIRENERQTGNHTPIIAMTAAAMKGDREKCLAVGMDGYIAKPVAAAELFETLERHVAASVDSADGKEQA